MKDSTVLSALHAGEIQFKIQPKFTVTDGVDSASLCGGELLAYWVNEGKLVSPLTFMPIIMAGGDECQLVKKAIDAACYPAMQDLPLSINISAELVEDISACNEIAEYGFKAQRKGELIFEVVETTPVTLWPRFLKGLGILREAGFKISLDDFGTGISNLEMLQKFEFDELKLDGSLIMPLVEDPRSQILVASAVTLAKDIGVSVVAEGVETPEVLKLVTGFGVQTIQGYLFAKPMLAQEFEIKRKINWH